MSSSRLKLLYGGLFVTGTLFGLVAALSRLPNFDLEMTREVPSKSSSQTLAAFMQDFRLWPRWFHMTTESNTIEANRIRLTIDPHKGEWKKFTLDLQVKENAEQSPKGRRLSVELLSDSKDKLRKMFSSLNWEVEVVPGFETPSIVRGTIHARTASWRSRLFGRISPRILLNQAFYPDLIGLAEIETPRLEPPLRMTP